MKDTIFLSKVKECDNTAISELIDGCISGKNAERNRCILKRRIIDGVRYEPLSEEFDLSVRQTKNIVYMGLSRLLSFI